MPPRGAADPTGPLLTLNAGSSSLKFALYEGEAARVRGAVKRVGSRDASLSISDEDSGSRIEHAVAAPDHAAALGAALDALGDRAAAGRLVAVGHRLVHGGPRYGGARLVTPEVIGELKRLRALDPDHLPAEIRIIETLAARSPRLPQVACFDTAFHRTMPAVARMLPIPARYRDAGVERYGFHGLSYSYLVQELARVAGPEAARGRLVLAHLGSGASLAAVAEGRSVETTMGFTPVSGVPMGTRSGDLDPGVVVYLLRAERLSANEVDELLNKRSGLLGVSGTTADMADLLAREASDPHAAEAVALFCHQVKKAVGALAAVLGGVDTLVFSGGIGEHAAPVRARVAEGLAHLGIRLDAARNAAGAPVISADGAPCTVRVIPTDEESVIARETRRVLEKEEE